MEKFSSKSRLLCGPLELTLLVHSLFHLVWIQAVEVLWICKKFMPKQLFLLAENCRHQKMNEVHIKSITFPSLFGKKCITQTVIS